MRQLSRDEAFDAVGRLPVRVNVDGILKGVEFPESPSVRRQGDELMVVIATDWHGEVRAPLSSVLVLEPGDRG